MPQLIIKGLKPCEYQPFAKKVRPELSKIVGCPEDWFTFDYQLSALYTSEGAIESFPVIQIWWFERPKDVQDAAAAFLDATLKEKGYRGSQISFHLFREEDYYEDGQHF